MYRYSVVYKTSADSPSQGKRTLDVFADSFEDAITNGNTALEAAGWTVTTKEAYDEAVVDLEDVSQTTYVVSYTLIGP